MMYYGRENPRATVPTRKRRVQPRHPHQLVRITDDDGLMRRPNGGKEYQKSCFICRQYRKEPTNTVWCCSTCGMPLCKKSRQRERTRHEEHKFYDDDPSLGCREGRDTFVLPKEYRLYEQAGLDVPSLPPDDDLFRSDDDDDNRGNGEREEENEEDFYSAASSDSDDEMNARARPDAAKKRHKRRSKSQAERRTQPRRTCKV